MKKLLIGLGVLLVIIVVLTLIFTQRANQEKRNKILKGQSGNEKLTPQPKASTIRTFVIYVKNWEFEPNIVRLNKGDKVTLKLKSLDVKHGFSLPAYNLQTSLDPFKFVSLQLVADRTGQFEYACTLNCGPAGYTGMKGTVIVE